jgi:hypothetical protein
MGETEVKIVIYYRDQGQLKPFTTRGTVNLESDLNELRDEIVSYYSSKRKIPAGSYNLYIQAPDDSTLASMKPEKMKTLLLVQAGSSFKPSDTD